MFEIKSLPMNMLEENCYIISDETCEAVVIDCGALYENDRQNIIRYVENRRLKITHHICTHMHYDHCFGAGFIQETFHVSPEFNIADKSVYYGEGDEIFGNLREIMRRGSRPTPERFLNEGDKILFGSHTLEVLNTPGHTQGGVCFYCQKEKALFSGDTLFHCSIGRTDFPGGNAELLCENIRKKLFSLPDDVMVYPGHGTYTNIGYEKLNNPYV